MNTEWKPIASAPKDGTRIAIKFSNGNEHQANWRATYGGEWHVDSFKYLPWADQHEITHWMPLAAAPCPTCNDQGAVGNILNAEPCPDCSPAPTSHPIPTGATGESIKLVHLAVAEDGGVRFMTGRKLPEGIESCELYAMPDYGRAPAELFRAPAAGDALDAARWRSFRSAITRQDLDWLERMDTALLDMGCDVDSENPPNDAQVDAAADSAIAQQSQRKEA